MQRTANTDETLLFKAVVLLDTSVRIVRGHSPKVSFFRNLRYTMVDQIP